jgi:hypothetical protein
MMAALSSGNEVNCRWRSPAMIQVATWATVFSTLALSLGCFTLPGSTAAE